MSDEKGVWRVVATFNDKTPLNDKKKTIKRREHYA